MAAEIKLTKTDESPWGFRLTGGRDFGTPLTIIKVAVHSVAEEAGLQVGDILVKINDVESSSLTHKEAQDLIIQSNNSITFSILRGSLSLSEAVIERLTPLPLRDFKTPEPTAQNQIKIEAPANTGAAVEPTIEVIPIQDLEPDLLEELGLNPLPEDFLEKAKRDPSPMPEVRPSSRMASPIDVLEALEELGLKNVVDDIERQKETVFHPVLPQPVTAEAQPEPEKVSNAEEVVPLSAENLVDQQNVPPPVQAIVPAEPTIKIDESSMQLLPISDLVQPIVIGGAETENLATLNNGEAVQPISEEEFAEFMSGKEEVLGVEGKNALGVDFTKFEPKADFLRKSQVFKTIQDSEHIVTREEKDKRWTTFLDKPKGPKPKPRPKPQPHYITEVVPVPEPEPTPEVDERKGLYEIPSEEEFEALIRVPTPPVAPVEPVIEECPEEPETLEDADNNVKQQLEEEQQNLQQQLEIEKQLNPEKFGVEKSEIELQLEEIQRQLQAIQQLPFEIQQHLALVQEQLNQIVQNRLHEQEGNEIPACPRPSMVDPSVLEEFGKTGEELPPLEESCQEVEEPKEETSENQIQPETESTEEVPVDEKKKDFKLRAEEEPAILPPPKKERPKKKRPFMGLGPAPRPLVLPGGRKWRTPKDAYNDEFIAETLSAQAEIITGTTLGVDFRKYEPKPPNLVHLRDSTVYKMIHDLEDPEIVNKGLASRPEIIPALQDYTQQSAPAAI